MRNEGAVLTSDGTPWNVFVGLGAKESTIRCVHVEPESFETNKLVDPLFATPTKILGVAFPDDPEVESNVTKAIPILSLL